MDRDAVQYQAQVRAGIRGSGFFSNLLIVAMVAGLLAYALVTLNEVSRDWLLDNQETIGAMQ